MRQLLLLLSFVTIVVGLQACSGDQNDENTIKIGHFASLSGLNATFGQQTDKGIKLAVDEINAAGGINGKLITLLTEDTRSLTQDAVNAANKLIGKDKVTVLLGEVASKLSIAAAPIAERNKVPMVTPASTNPEVTIDRNGDVRTYVYRICFIDPFQGRVMAKFARENLSASRVAILKDNANDYSVGLARNFKETFEALGGTIVAEQAYEAGQKDFKSQLTDIKSTAPDAIFVPGYYTEVGLVAIQARDLGLQMPLLGGDGWDSPQLTEGQAKAALEGCFFSNHYSVEDATARVREFTEKYQTKWGEMPGAMSALGYDAMRIVAHVMNTAGTDSKKIINGLSAIENFDGVTGTITINEDHNAQKPAVVLQIRGGKFTYHTTVEP